MFFVVRVSSLLIISSLLLLSACGLDQHSKTPSGPDSTESSGADIGKSDLLDLLQGTWFDEKDGTKMLDIKDDTLRHMNGDQILDEALLTISSDCSKQACQKPATRQGWCFVAANGSTSDCFLVLECTHQTLRFVRLGGESEQIYRRP